MDHREFTEWLSSVAEWTLGDLRSDNRGRNGDSRLNQINESFPVELIAVKPTRSCCDHCGKIVENQRFTHKIQKQAVFSRCDACEYWQDPKTGEFTVQSNQIGLIMRRHHDD